MGIKFIRSLFFLTLLHVNSTEAEVCGESALIIPRQTAEFVIYNKSEAEIIYSVNDDSDSIAIQLYFWMYMLGEDESLAKLSELDLLSLLGRADDSINSVIWLAFHDPGFGAFFNVNRNEILNKLNKWFNDFRSRNKRVSDILLIELTRIYPNTVNSSDIFSGIQDMDSVIPHWTFDSAKANQLSSKPQEAYALLKRAAENGALVFFDLGTYEYSFLPGCKERAKFSFSIQRASRPWIK